MEVLNRRALVLEDDADNREALRQLLEAFGYEVDSFEKTGMAEDAVRSARHDVAFFDAHLGDEPVSRVVTLIGLKKDEDPSCFLVAMSNQKEANSQLRLAGCHDAVMKHKLCALLPNLLSARSGNTVRVAA